MGGKGSAERMDKILEESISGFRPVGDRIVVKPEEIPDIDETDTGIFVTKTNKRVPYVGEVLAVADEIEDIQEGDTVYYAPFAGHQIAINGEDVLVLEEEDVLGVIDKVVETA